MTGVEAFAVPAPVMDVQQLRDFLASHFALMGQQYEVHEVTPTGLTMRLEINAAHERPGGTVSGPVMMGMVDGAAWLATLSRIGPVALAVTSSLTINFLEKPGLNGELLAHASLLRLGHRNSVSDVRVISYPADGSEPKLVAQASVTYAIPRR